MIGTILQATVIWAKKSPEKKLQFSYLVNSKELHFTLP